MTPNEVTHGTRGRNCDLRRPEYRASEGTGEADSNLPSVGSPSRPEEVSVNQVSRPVSAEGTIRPSGGHSTDGPGAGDGKQVEVCSECLGELRFYHVVPVTPSAPCYAKAVPLVSNLLPLARHSYRTADRSPVAPNCCDLCGQKAEHEIHSLRDVSVDPQNKAPNPLQVRNDKWTPEEIRVAEDDQTAFPHSVCNQCGKLMPSGTVQRCEHGGYCSWSLPTAARDRMTELVCQRNALLEALKLSRTYVAAMHSNIASAMGHERTVIRPDLGKIDAAISKAQGGR